MSNILECKAIRKSGKEFYTRLYCHIYLRYSYCLGDICVAQYLPRMLKDEYFGIFSLLGYNMLRCNLTKSRELELIILMSLMTLLDKSNDGSWKRDFVSKGGETQDELIYNEARETKKEPTSTVLPAIAYEDPIPTKSMQKKYKKEQLNDQKLQLLLEKDVKRSQKQIQTDQKQFMTSLSADNSPAHTPKTSPLPTPSTSTSNIIRSPRLNHQKSMNALNSTSTPNQQQASREKTNQNGGGRLSRLFSSLSHVKQSSNNSTAEPSSNMSSPIIKSNKALPATTSQQYVTTSNQQLRRQQSHKQFEYNDSDYYDSHHLSLPTGYVAQRITNEFGNLSINNNNYDNPPSLRTIRWNPEPSSSYVQQPQYYVSRSNSQGRKKSHLVVEDGRRLSASEYSGYPYHYTNNNTNRYSASEYYMPSYQHSHPFDYYL